MAGCTTMRGCGWRLTSCTGGGCTGVPVPIGSSSTYSMETPPATISVGSGWLAASAINPIFLTARTWSVIATGSIAKVVQAAGPALSMAATSSSSRSFSRFSLPFERAMADEHSAPDNVRAHNPLEDQTKTQAPNALNGPADLHHPLGA